MTLRQRLKCTHFFEFGKKTVSSYKSNAAFELGAPLKATPTGLKGRGGKLVYAAKPIDRDLTFVLAATAKQGTLLNPVGDSKGSRVSTGPFIYPLHKANATEGKHKKGLAKLKLHNRNSDGIFHHQRCYPLLSPLTKVVVDTKGLVGEDIFWNVCFDKGRLKNFVSWFLQMYGEYKTIQLVEQLKNVGFEYATKAGISLGIEDLKIPPRKATLILEAEKLTKVTITQYNRGEISGVERFQRLIDTWHRTSELLKQEVIDNFEATDILNPVYMMAFSGARGNISQVRQLVGMRGLMADPQGQIIDFPIRSNFREGLTLTEYIISSYGARKGIVDTALRTANAGYLTRRLVDVAQHVVVSQYDCGTNRGLFLTEMKESNKIIYSLQNRLIGRILAKDIYKGNSGGCVTGEMSDRSTYGTSDGIFHQKIASRNQEVSTDLAFTISKNCTKVFVRSSLTCETKKLVCQLCYGWALAQGSLVSIGEAVGIVAAQSIGEPGTQLTMRTFHTGGVFSGDVSEQIRAPYNGYVQYSSAVAGTLIRTAEGQIAFLTKNEAMLFVLKASYPITVLNNLSLVNANDAASNSLPTLFNPQTGLIGKPTINTKDIRKYKIPAYTVLFIRNNENVVEKQVIAQISSLSRQKTIRDDAELTIKAEMEGQFYAKTLSLQRNLVGPKIKEPSDAQLQTFLDPVVEARDWSFAWILSGKIYELPMPTSFFPQQGDFINTSCTVNQTRWLLASHGGIVSYLYVSNFELNKKRKVALGLAGSDLKSPLAQPFLPLLLALPLPKVRGSSLPTVVKSELQKTNYETLPGLGGLEKNKKATLTTPLLRTTTVVLPQRGTTVGSKVHFLSLRAKLTDGNTSSKPSKTPTLAIKTSSSFIRKAHPSFVKKPVFFLNVKKIQYHNIGYVLHPRCSTYSGSPFAPLLPFTTPKGGSRVPLPFNPLPLLPTVGTTTVGKVSKVEVAWLSSSVGTRQVGVKVSKVPLLTPSTLGRAKIKSNDLIFTAHSLQPKGSHSTLQNYQSSKDNEHTWRRRTDFVTSLGQSHKSLSPSISAAGESKSELFSQEFGENRIKHKSNYNGSMASNNKQNALSLSATNWNPSMSKFIQWLPQNSSIKNAGLFIFENTVKKSVPTVGKGCLGVSFSTALLKTLHQNPTPISYFGFNTKEVVVASQPLLPFNPLPLLLPSVATEGKQPVVPLWGRTTVSNVGLDQGPKKKVKITPIFMKWFKQPSHNSGPNGLSRSDTKKNHYRVCYAKKRHWFNKSGCLRQAEHDLATVVDVPLTVSDLFPSMSIRQLGFCRSDSMERVRGARCSSTPASNGYGYSPFIKNPDCAVELPGSSAAPAPSISYSYRVVTETWVQTKQGYTLVRCPSVGFYGGNLLSNFILPPDYLVSQNHTDTLKSVWGTTVGVEVNTKPLASQPLLAFETKLSQVLPSATKVVVVRKGVSLQNPTSSNKFLATQRFFYVPQPCYKLNTTTYGTADSTTLPVVPTGVSLTVGRNKPVKGTGDNISQPKETLKTININKNHYNSMRSYFFCVTTFKPFSSVGTSQVALALLPINPLFEEPPMGVGLKRVGTTYSPYNPLSLLPKVSKFSEGVEQQSEKDLERLYQDRSTLPKVGTTDGIFHQGETKVAPTLLSYLKKRPGFFNTKLGENPSYGWQPIELLAITYWKKWNYSIQNLLVQTLFQTYSLFVKLYPTFFYLKDKVELLDLFYNHHYLLPFLGLPTYYPTISKVLPYRTESGNRGKARRDTKVVRAKYETKHKNTFNSPYLYTTCNQRLGCFLENKIKKIPSFADINKATERIRFLLPPSSADSATVVIPTTLFNPTPIGGKRGLIGRLSTASLSTGEISRPKVAKVVMPSAYRLKGNRGSGYSGGTEANNLYSHVTFKKGWVYKPTNMLDALKYDKKVILAGDLLLDHIIFDRLPSSALYIECVHLKEKKTIHNLLSDFLWNKTNPTVATPTVATPTVATPTVATPTVGVASVAMHTAVDTNFKKDLLWIKNSKPRFGASIFRLLDPTVTEATPTPTLPKVGRETTLPLPYPSGVKVAMPSAYRLKGKGLKGSMGSRSGEGVLAIKYPNPFDTESSTNDDACLSAAKQNAAFVIVFRKIEQYNLIEPLNNKLNVQDLLLTSLQSIKIKPCLKLFSGKITKTIGSIRKPFNSSVLLSQPPLAVLRGLLPTVSKGFIVKKIQTKSKVFLINQKLNSLSLQNLYRSAVFNKQLKTPDIVTSLPNIDFYIEQNLLWEDLRFDKSSSNPTVTLPLWGGYPNFDRMSPLTSVARLLPSVVPAPLPFNPLPFNPLSADLLYNNQITKHKKSYSFAWSYRPLNFNSFTVNYKNLNFLRVTSPNLNEKTAPPLAHAPALLEPGKEVVAPSVVRNEDSQTFTVGAPSMGLRSNQGAQILFNYKKQAPFHVSFYKTSIKNTTNWQCFSTLLKNLIQIGFLTLKKQRLPYPTLGQLGRVVVASQKMLLPLLVPTVVTPMGLKGRKVPCFAVAAVPTFTPTYPKGVGLGKVILEKAVKKLRLKKEILSSIQSIIPILFDSPCLDLNIKSTLLVNKNGFFASNSINCSTTEGSVLSKKKQLSKTKFYVSLGNNLICSTPVAQTSFFSAFEGELLTFSQPKLKKNPLLQSLKRQDALTGRVYNIKQKQASFGFDNFSSMPENALLPPLPFNLFLPQRGTGTALPNLSQREVSKVVPVPLWGKRGKGGQATDIGFEQPTKPWSYSLDETKKANEMQTPPVFAHSCLVLTKKDLVSFSSVFTQSSSSTLKEIKQQADTRLKRLCLGDFYLQGDLLESLDTSNKTTGLNVSGQIVHLSTVISPFPTLFNPTPIGGKRGLIGNATRSVPSMGGGNTRTMLHMKKCHTGYSPFSLQNPTPTYPFCTLMGGHRDKMYRTHLEASNPLPLLPTVVPLWGRTTVVVPTTPVSKLVKGGLSLVIDLTKEAVDLKKEDAYQNFKSPTITVGSKGLNELRTVVTLRRAQPIFISPKGVFHVHEGDFVRSKAPVITLAYQRLKTGDIIEGIPKVEQFFEARTTKHGRLFKDSLPNLLRGLFGRYRKKGFKGIVPKRPKENDLQLKSESSVAQKKRASRAARELDKTLSLNQAVRQSFYKIQQIIVDGVQRVYRSQGAAIADKHLEVIVKQMTSKVQIVKGGQTDFFPGELVDFEFIGHVNTMLFIKVQYQPVVLGITKASLQVKSFLSAASFQQTTRVLSEAAINKRQDFLKGLKENVMLGNLIPAGTGYLVYLDF